MVGSKSISHLQGVCMSYATHMCFSLRLSLLFFKASIGAIVHALVPGLCITSSTYYSTHITSLIHTSGCVEA